MYVCTYIHIYTNISRACTRANSRDIRKVLKGKRTAFFSRQKNLAHSALSRLLLAGRFYASINCKVSKRAYFTVIEQRTGIPNSLIERWFVQRGL